MSSDPFGSNPYSPPKPLADPIYQPAPLLDAPAGPWQMNYFGAFDMIHRRPDWFVNVLLTSLCGLIPVIGGIVVWGYSYEVVEILHRTNGSFYPKFDFNRFVEYLLRGLGAFLILLIVNTVMGVVLSPVVIILFSAAGAAGKGGPGGQDALIMVMLAVFGTLLIVFVSSIVTSFLYVPMSLRGGLASDVGGSFNFRWAIDFVKKTWLEMLLVFLFQFAASFVAWLIVEFSCLLGILVVIGYLGLINAWLNFQLYRVYLSRGGEPVPFKPAPLPLPAF